MNNALKNNEYSWAVEASGERLDVFLAKSLPQFSRSAIKEMLRSGYVRCNQKKAKAGLRLTQGDMVTATLPNAVNQVVGPVTSVAEPTLVWQSDDILVLNKPAGMHVFGQKGNFGNLTNTVLHWLHQTFPETQSLNDTGYWGGILHRIDQGTSGALLVARHGKALSVLKKAMEDGSIKKTYIALVH